ncbi:PiggyBac transposable element-derived protein 4-like [Elysia marginata]|uniref:PiggyBac transposable element-derived protein 4-like n=1 Tax=Elysia marginata TaxID=1093978 RepID=A0AAV4GBD5_9GAST|nr:PiggyBac transposable element-derived protein 4-like [Elysia marginata]
MKRALEQPALSSGKRQQRLFSRNDVLQQIIDSESDEREFNQEYPFSEESSESDLDLNLDETDDSSRPISRSSSTDESRSRPDDLDGGGDRPRLTEENLDLGWAETFTEPASSFTVFRQFSRRNGSVNIPEEVTEGIQFLSLFTDDEFWNNLVAMTNLRARPANRSNQNSYYAKSFTDTNTDEMKAFVGIRYYMEYICVKLSYRDYWSSDGVDFLGFTPGFRAVMTRDRFLALWTFLHLVDEEDDSLDKTDKLYKVRPMMEDFLIKFRHYYIPSQHLSLDEKMIPTKNRLSIKQYIKSKPTKWGIKSFLLCEAETGYIVNAENYTGAGEIINSKLGATGNVVIRLVLSANVGGKGHILVMDRYYNSILLAIELFKIHIGVVRTIMSDRKHVPTEVKLKKLAQRGSSYFQSHKNITCMVWQDRKPILFISNYHQPDINTEADRRKKDSTVEKIDMPLLVKDYDSYMGGCDRNDQMTRLNRSRRHYRWPRRLFVKFFMWACYNSFVLFISKRPGASSKVYFTRYIQDLCISLVGTFRSTARLSIHHKPRDIRFTQGNHFPFESPNASSDNTCVVCSEKHNRFKRSNPDIQHKDNPHKLVKTTVMCALCKKYLCVKRASQCWSNWHTKAEYWR